MRARTSYVAILVHTSGAHRGLREEIEMPLLGHAPPETLRRPVNLGGAPMYEIWTLASTDDWSSGRRASFTLSGHTARDPMSRPVYGSAILPWSSASIDPPRG